MSTILSTMASALIDFILSLLRDPAMAEQFDQEPQATLSAHGLGGATYEDVCSVLPVVYDHPSVIQRVVPVATGGGDPDIVREIRNVMSTNSYITNNSTLVDQSVNQNIWAQGDVMQLFDNEAVIASGQDSTAAGHDVVHDSGHDASTHITAGGNAVVDNTIDVDTAVDSYNQDSSTTEASTTTTLTDVDVVAAGVPAIDEPAAAEPADSGADTGADAFAADDGVLPEPDPVEESFVDDGY